MRSAFEVVSASVSASVSSATSSSSVSASVSSASPSVSASVSASVSSVTSSASASASPSSAKSHWDEVLRLIISNAEKGLSFIASRELDGDEVNGISEKAFKLLIFGFFGVVNELNIHQVSSERMVDGGRIDIYLEHLPTKSALVIELKYIRVGFLESTKFDGWPREFEKISLWKKENDNLKNLPRIELGNVRVRDYYSKKERIREIRTYCLDAVDQARRYCNALRDGGVNPKVKKESVRLFHCAIIGVGTVVFGSDVIEYD